MLPAFCPLKQLLEVYETCWPNIPITSTKVHNTRFILHVSCHSHPLKCRNILEIHRIFCVNILTLTLVRKKLDFGCQENTLLIELLHEGIISTKSKKAFETWLHLPLFLSLTQNINRTEKCTKQKARVPQTTIVYERSVELREMSSTYVANFLAMGVENLHLRMVKIITLILNSCVSILMQDVSLSFEN